MGLWNNPPYYLTAYGLAVKHGFIGSEKKWLESLKGEPGKDLMIVDSFATYEAMTERYPGIIAKPEGFIRVGTTEDYLLYYWDDEDESWYSIDIRGKDGQGAYEIAVANGYQGTPGEFREEMREFVLKAVTASNEAKEALAEAEQLNEEAKVYWELASVLAQIIAGGGSGDTENSFAAIQKATRLGVVQSLQHVGNVLTVKRGILTGAEVIQGEGLNPMISDYDKLHRKTGSLKTTSPDDTEVTIGPFERNGSDWYYDGKKISLSDFGIIAGGMYDPAEGDSFVFKEKRETIEWEIADFDRHVPTEAGLIHSVQLLTRKPVKGMKLAVDQESMDETLQAEVVTLPFGRKQAMLQIKEGILPAGSWYVTLDSSIDTADRGSFNYIRFTTTKTLSNGGKVYLHWPEGSSLSNATISTYADGMTEDFEEYIGELIEGDLPISNSTSGATGLGTVKMETRGLVTYQAPGVGGNPGTTIKVNINAMAMVRGGATAYMGSPGCEWLNETESGDTSFLPEPKYFPEEAKENGHWTMETFSLKYKADQDMQYFLHGLDPDFKAVLGEVTLRTAKIEPQELDAYGLAIVSDEEEEAYTDDAVTGWLPSITELGFGANGADEDIDEVSPGGAGNDEDGAFALFTDDASRIRKNGSTAVSWWTRSPDPENMGKTYIVTTDGTQGNKSAADETYLIVGFDIV